MAQFESHAYELLVSIYGQHAVTVEEKTLHNSGVSCSVLDTTTSEQTSMCAHTVDDNLQIYVISLMN
jgi:hypothetical protein